MGSLIVVHDDQIKRFEASFPSNDVPNPPKYVCLQTDRSFEILRSSKRQGGIRDIYVSRSSGLMDQAVVSFKEATVNRYRWYVLWRDRDSKLALLGLVMALAGVYVDGSLAVGKIKPLWHFSDSWILGFSILSYVLKVPGLILAFLGIFLKQTSQA